MCKSLDYIDSILDSIEFIESIKKEYNLNKDEIDIKNKESSDILHFIEFNEYEDKNKLKLFNELREVRIERRRLKEENERLRILHKFLKSKGLYDNKKLVKFKNNLKEVRKLIKNKIDVQSNREFGPRVREDLKEEYSDKSRLEVLKTVMEGNNN